MPPSRREQEPGRFTGTDTRGSGVLSGYQQTSSRFDAAFIKRNIEAYKEYGFPQDLSRLAQMTDTQRESAAAKAVIAKYLASKKPDEPTKPDKPKPDPKPKPPPGGGGSRPKPKPPGGGGRPKPRPQPPRERPRPKPPVRKPPSKGTGGSRGDGGTTPRRPGTGGSRGDGGTTYKPPTNVQRPQNRQKPPPGTGGGGNSGVARPKPTPKPNPGQGRGTGGRTAL